MKRAFRVHAFRAVRADFGEKFAFIRIGTLLRRIVVDVAVATLTRDKLAILAFVAPRLALGGATHFGRVPPRNVISAGVF